MWGVNREDNLNYYTPGHAFYLGIAVVDTPMWLPMVLQVVSTKDHSPKNLVLKNQLAGVFEFGDVLNTMLKKKPATAVRKGVKPFTKKPCIFKVEPVSKNVNCFAVNMLFG